MKYGQALAEAIESQGDTKISAAKIALVNNSTLGKYTNGSRKPPKDVIRRTAQHYDDGKLFMAAANEVTGDAWVPWLDKADLHRASVHLKAMEEVEEAIASMRNLPVSKKGDQVSAEERQLIRKAISENIEAITALTHHVAVLCKEYTFSWIGVWNDHRKELKAKGYLSK